MLNLQMPSPTSLNQPICLPRIPKSALEWRDELWYWQGDVFDGYLYDIVTQRRVEIWRVEAGQVMSRYFPEEFCTCCQVYEIVDPPIIDITGFNMEDYSALTDWGTRNHPYYKDGMTIDGLCLIVDGLPYTGMSIYVANDFVCNEEIWKDGYSVASIDWYYITFFKVGAIFFEYPNLTCRISYPSKLDPKSFILLLKKDSPARLDISFNFNNDTPHISSLEIMGSFDKNELKKLISLDLDLVFDSILSFSFEKRIRFSGNKMNGALIKKIISKNHFFETEKIIIHNLDLTKEFFMSLSEIKTLKTLDIESSLRESAKDLIDFFQQLRPDVEIISFI